MSAWAEPIDYLRWELSQIRTAHREALRLLATCPPEHRDTYRTLAEQWAARERAKEEEIAEDMAPLPAPMASRNGRTHTMTVPRSLAEAERQGDGALGRLFDAENRAEQVYDWAY